MSSEGPVEEDSPTLPITSALYNGMDVNKSRLSCDSEDLRQGDDHATAHLLADSSSIVQAHAISDPIFAPVRKIPPEILAKIFIECIPSLELKKPATLFWKWDAPATGSCSNWSSLSNVERCFKWWAWCLGDAGSWWSAPGAGDCFSLD